MKIWIDILTPKQVMFFARLIKNLQSKGHETLVTTREYKETNQLLSMHNVSAICIGKHGGKTPAGKIDASLERMLELNKLVEKEAPDLLISLSSPEASRIAFGLKIRHFCLNDIPEAEAVAKLTIPLCTKLITPKLIGKKVWAKFGISPEKIVQYNSLDPVAWLRNFKPNAAVLDSIGIDRSKPIVVFRAEEIFASYLNDKFSMDNSVILPIVNSLMEKIDANFIILPRYAEQENFIREHLKGDAIILHKVIDGQSLLHYANVFAGGGGTMTIESALLGTPTVDCRQIDTLYEDFVIKKGLAFKIREPKKAVDKIMYILKNNGQYKKELKRKANLLIKGMEDPIKVIEAEIEKI